MGNTEQKYPVGTVVLMAFRVTGYDRDFDGSPMARLENIDFEGETTGWTNNNIGLYPGDHMVVTTPELKKLKMQNEQR